MDNLIDVEKDQMEILRKIINRHVPGKEIWAYGSRLTRKAEAFSDLDLVVFDCDSHSTEDFREALEESDLLFSVDVMEWESLPEDFRENIKRKYVVLQRRREVAGLT